MEIIPHKMLEQDPFSKWLGIKIIEAGNGTCTLTMKVRNDMLNGFGIAHGGIAYSLADTALAFASNTHGKKAVSIETTINHLEPIQEGVILTAYAIEESLKNKLAIYSVIIKSNDVKIALFKGTVYRTRYQWDKN